MREPPPPNQQMLTALVAALTILVVGLGVALVRGPLANRALTPTPTSVDIISAALTPTSVTTVPTVATQETVAASRTPTPFATAAPVETASGPTSVGVVQPTDVFAPEPSLVAPVPLVPTSVVPTPVVPSIPAPTLPPASVPPPVAAPPELLPTATPPGPVTSAQPTLARGATGAAVEDLQRRLNAWMTNTQPAGLAPLEVDGIFGPRTEAAVRAFQQAQGLSVDGVVGPQTWQRLLTLTP